MPCYGGLNPAPRRMGGGKPRAKLLLDALIAARGTAVNAGDPGTIAYVETLAIARALAAAWSTNQRLANQWDAKRMTSMLSRWEEIFAIRPNVDDELSARRRRVEMAQARVGRAAILTTIRAELEAALGDVFVAVEFISVENAIISVPNNAYPFGIVVPRHPWSSSVSQILIRLQDPYDSKSAFYDAVSLIGDIIEPMIPAWVSWIWYRAPEFGTPFDVPGGPSAGGFYLDERNLNESVFRI